MGREDMSTLEIEIRMDELITRQTEAEAIIQVEQRHGISHQIAFSVQPKINR